MKAEARESYLLGKLSTTPPSHISSLHFVLSDVYKWNFQIHFFDCSISVHKDHCGLLGGGEGSLLPGLRVGLLNIFYEILWSTKK